jgi:hypothetical protein
MSLTLPTSKIPAVSENPRYLILYGLPKAGKTSCLAQLDNNLIIDLEGGSVFVVNCGCLCTKHNLYYFNIRNANISSLFSA